MSLTYKVDVESYGGRYADSAASLARMGFVHREVLGRSVWTLTSACFDLGDFVRWTRANNLYCTITVS